MKLHQGGKPVSPQEHRQLCDWGAQAQPTKRQLQV
ncbi:addiction module toxin RelE [Serratia marcescens]|uniref:Addiction module toxin RelE n=1 Tax=Serratia marcescens TaxID=615 RepID=A0AB33G1X4_SERMA|nr:addiction module toxin RelE [Serratia sp. SSNIH1]AWL67513.1 addiction module toxin RelE [Serratia marcescens]POU56937.1 addiction module toxin RelE [Serratia sp. SSNIH4]POW42174.1 addiction module toxin RelE [Serratia sp. SSNIH5]POW43793.1 addiction module toxin RelE [Serratia sp. SSNIH2]POW63942.1 addiction module toxin RelE [Serratia sp. SSNIH3]